MNRFLVGAMLAVLHLSVASSVGAQVIEFGNVDFEEITIDTESEQGVIGWHTDYTVPGDPDFEFNPENPQPPSPFPFDKADINQFFDSPFAGKLPSHPVTGTPIYDMALPTPHRRISGVAQNTHYRAFESPEYGAEINWSFIAFGADGQPDFRAVDFTEPRPMDVNLNVRWLGNPRQVTHDHPDGPFTVTEYDILSEYDQVARMHGYRTADALFASRPHGEPPAGVPEPASILLFGPAAAWMAWKKRKRLVV